MHLYTDYQVSDVDIQRSSAIILARLMIIKAVVAHAAMLMLQTLHAVLDYTVEVCVRYRGKLKPCVMFGIQNDAVFVCLNSMYFDLLRFEIRPTVKDGC